MESRESGLFEQAKGKQSHSLSDFTEQRIARKYQLKAALCPVSYTYSDDAALTFQYYRLRGQAANAQDALGSLLLAHRDKLCIGGLRLTLSLPELRCVLPAEHAGLHLESLGLSPHAAYGELDALVLLREPQAEMRRTAMELLHRQIMHSRQLGATHLIALVERHQLPYFEAMEETLGIHWQSHAPLSRDEMRITPLVCDITPVKAAVKERDLTEA